MKFIISIVFVMFTVPLFAQDYLEDTVDQQKYESLYRACKYQIENMERSNPDIASLYKTLLTIQASKNCASIQSFSPEELGRTRGGAPCSINPKNKLTGISFGKIGVVLADGSQSSLDWDTGHIADMSFESYVYKGTQYAKPMVEQLIKKGLCKDLHTKAKKGGSKAPKKFCHDVHLNIIDFTEDKISDFYNKHQVFFKDDIGKIKTREFEYVYTDEKGNRCHQRVYDESGATTIGLTLLKVKEKYIRSNGGYNVEFSDLDLQLVQEGISKFAESSKALDDKGYYGERARALMDNAKKLKQIMKSKSDSNTISKDAFQEALNIMDSMSTGEHKHYSLVEDISGNCVSNKRGNTGTITKDNGSKVKVAKYTLDGILNTNLSKSNPFELDSHAECVSDVALGLMGGGQGSQQAPAPGMIKN